METYTQNEKVALLPEIERIMQNMTSKTWEKCQPFWLNSSFSYPQQSGLCCSTECILLRSQECRAWMRGWARRGGGTACAHSLLRENIPQGAAKQGRRETAHCLMFPHFAGTDSDIFWCSPLKLPLRELGSRKHSQIFDSGLFRRVERTETASSWWALSSVSPTISSSFGERGWLCLQWLRHSIYEKWRGKSVWFMDPKKVL